MGGGSSRASRDRVVVVQRKASGAHTDAPRATAYSPQPAPTSASSIAGPGAQLRQQQQQQQQQQQLSPSVGARTASSLRGPLRDASVASLEVDSPAAARHAESVSGRVGASAASSGAQPVNAWPTAGDGSIGLPSTLRAVSMMSSSGPAIDRGELMGIVEEVLRTMSSSGAHSMYTSANASNGTGSASASSTANGNSGSYDNAGQATPVLPLEVGYGRFKHYTFEQLAAFIRSNEVGRTSSIQTVAGTRLVMYADLTASGRFLRFVESFIQRVYPYYANVHTSISSLGSTLTSLRESSRTTIARALNARHPDDYVIFSGSGATAALNKLIGLLGIRVDHVLFDQFPALKDAIELEKRPIVLCGPYEHHSNILPWVQSVATVLEIKLDPTGTVDYDDLERKASSPAFAKRPLKIGTFSAASNVTGVVTDVHRVARILHKYGFYAVFDFAGGGPYMPINMHPADPAERLDAVALSVHKFIGGPGSSGVLAVSRELVRNHIPVMPGGGTVEFVYSTDADRPRVDSNPARGSQFTIDYTHNVEEREEGGTPAILADIRAGVAVMVKQLLTPEAIFRHETRIAANVVSRLSAHHNIKVLGPGTEVERVAIISFVVHRVHHNLISSLMDALFGVQVRSGCSCAGPYGLRLLDMDPVRLRNVYHKYNGMTGIKPGWVRLSIPYYFSEADIEFLVSTVLFVATHARSFLPYYTFSWMNGRWSPRKQVANEPPIALTPAALLESTQTFGGLSSEEAISEEQIAMRRQSYLDKAHKLVAKGEEVIRQEMALGTRVSAPTGLKDVDSLVFFDYLYHTDLPAEPGSA